MDDIFDPVLLPSSWADVDSPHSSSWISTTASQPSNIIPESFGTYRNNLQNLHGSLMIPSDHMVGNLPFHEPSVHMNGGSSSIFGADNIKCGVNPCYFSSENQLHHNIPNHMSLQPQPGTTESNQPTGSFCVERGSVGSNESDPSAYHQSLEDSQSTSADPLLWPSSYSNVHSLLIEQQVDLHFGLQQKFVENDGALQPGIFQESENEFKELNNSEIPSFTGGSDMNLTGNHIQSNDQPLQSSKGNPAQPYISNASITPAQSMSANANGLNGTPKPRTRARRGQATDPHSIAERLRREKIADRMKNLQELVPNSNKADKASMLDEIIDYVKFLQLQVKVLSMSRLGAAGAVVPLITDIQSEGNGSLLSPSSVELGDNDPSETDDNLAFEQEVVKLMESNITMAMQYLQTKGLCLMPTALAAAISSRKGTSVAAIPPGKRKPDTSPAIVSNESMRKEISDRRELPKNSNGITVKHEDARTASKSGKE